MKRIEFEDALVVEPAKVSVLDELPVGSVIDYDGDTVPEGFEKVEDNEVILYENTNGTNNTIALKDDITNYKSIEINYFNTYSGELSSTGKIYNANGKYINLSQIVNVNNETLEWFSANISVSDKTITFNRNCYIWSSNMATGTDATLKITKIIGYK